MNLPVQKRDQPVVRMICATALLFVAAGCQSTSVSRYQSHRDFHWHTAVTEHFIIYFEPGTYPEQRMEGLRSYLEQSWRGLQSLLELPPESPPARPIHVFLVDSHDK